MRCRAAGQRGSGGPGVPPTPGRDVKGRRVPGTLPPVRRPAKKRARNRPPRHLLAPWRQAAGAPGRGPWPSPRRRSVSGPLACGPSRTEVRRPACSQGERPHSFSLAGRPGPGIRALSRKNNGPVRSLRGRRPGPLQPSARSEGAGKRSHGSGRVAGPYGRRSGLNGHTLARVHEPRASVGVSRGAAAARPASAGRRPSAGAVLAGAPCRRTGRG